MADIEVIDGESIELFIEEYGIQVPNAEVVYETSTPDLQRSNGGLQVLTLIEDSKLTAEISNGQSITVMLDMQGFTLDVTDFSTEYSFLLDPSEKNLVCIFNLLGTNYIIASGRFQGAL